MTPTFVVGTGRCGSTLISNLLRQHSEVLSISEFFTFTMDLGGRMSEAFQERELTGPAFWEMISARMPRENLLMNHDVVPSEVLYPFTNPAAKFSVETGVPAISQITLPHLTDDFDSLFEELAVQIVRQPTGSLRSHYDGLFAWLMRRLDKKLWVERSGGSFVYFDALLALYPKAKFVHIVRDGRDTALSMAKHYAFRIFMFGTQITEILGYDPYETDARHNIDKLPAELACFLPENFDRDAFLAAEPPLQMMGQLWTDQIITGISNLQKLSSERVLTVSYENLCDAPQSQLGEIIDFIGAEKDLDWISKVTKSVTRSPNSWQTLADDRKKPLEEACAPGMELVAEILS